MEIKRDIDRHSLILYDIINKAIERGCIMWHLRKKKMNYHI